MKFNDLFHLWVMTEGGGGVLLLLVLGVALLAGNCSGEGKRGQKATDKAGATQHHSARTHHAQ